MSDIYKGNHLKGEIEIIKPVKVFENKYLKVYNDEVIFPGDYIGEYTRIINNNENSVAVLPLTDENTCVLIKTFRHGMRGWCYEIPKGGIEKDESPETAAKREMLEETGYTTQNPLIYIGEYSDSPAIMSGTIKCYIAINCKKESEPLKEKTEAITDSKLFDVEEFLKSKDKLDFEDALTELLILKYTKKRRDFDEQHIPW